MPCPVTWMFPDVLLDLIYPGIAFAFLIMISCQDLQSFCAVTQLLLLKGVLMRSLDASLAHCCMACPHLVKSLLKWHWGDALSQYTVCEQQDICDARETCGQNLGRLLAQSATAKGWWCGGVNSVCNCITWRE